MPPFKRHDGRKANELRAVKLTPGFVRKADGSCLIEIGGTRVICTASVTAGVPEWLAGKGRGWVTAEYGMLPASTGSRKGRPTLKPDGRAVEIQRLIGRALRSVVDFAALGENTIYLDCDVLEADGGTRTAAITGAYVALVQAVNKAVRQGLCRFDAVSDQVAAVSVGLMDGRAVLDLDYPEDSAAEVDMNVALLKGGRFIDIQASSERKPFDAAQLGQMIKLAAGGIRTLMDAQRRAIGEM